LGKRDFKMAQLLYQRGADIEVRGCYERTLLYAASISGASEIAQWLLNHGADPNVRANAGGARSWTPLHSAALYGYPEFTRTLLQFRADRSNRQISSHLISNQRHPSTVGLMLKGRDLDINAQDMDGFTPLHLASAAGVLDVVRLLVEHGADTEARDKAGRTPFQVALVKGHDEITNYYSLNRHY
jgi:ankyrin repeat protein